jgi:hypothetical protein
MPSHCAQVTRAYKMIPPLSRAYIVPFRNAQLPHDQIIKQSK